ncbi:acyl carrier protein [Streptomyces sp. NPDC002588]|uniref:acyl carrier protein n=1 Tax=Streptomyces sp. NPDC002588 TaxID=3154419 RepID=UPI00332655B2
MNREDIREAVFEQLRGELPLADHHLEESDPLISLPNADSVHLLTVAAQLERKFAVEFNDQLLFGAKAVGDLVDLVEQALAEAEAR